MTKADLVDRVTALGDLTRRDGEIIVDTLFESVIGLALVFMPTVGEYVIPELLGGPNTQMIGRTLYNEFFSNRDWPTASAIAIAILVLLVGPLMIFQRYQDRQMEKAE